MHAGFLTISQHSTIGIVNDESWSKSLETNW
jgi:hypothetical protein